MKDSLIQSKTDDVQMLKKFIAQQTDHITLIQSQKDDVQMLKKFIAEQTDQITKEMDQRIKPIQEPTTQLHEKITKVKTRTYVSTLIASNSYLNATRVLNGTADNLRE